MWNKLFTFQQGNEVGISYILCTSVQGEGNSNQKVFMLLKTLF